MAFHEHLQEHPPTPVDRDEGTVRIGKQLQALLGDGRQCVHSIELEAALTDHLIEPVQSTRRSKPKADRSKR